MGDYDNVITRADNQANVPETIDTMLRRNLSAQSAALQLFPIVPMATNQTRMPVLAALPTAYFVTGGDTGLKKTSDMAWANKYLNVEELAVIVPVPEAVLADSSFPIWESARPHMEQAIGRAVDQAIFFGVNKPSSWPASIEAGARAASSPAHTYVRGTNNAAAGGIAADFSNLFSLVEADGYDVDMVIANRTYKGLLRNARDADGNHQDDVTANNVYDVEVTYPMRGLWPVGSGEVSAIVGSRNEGIIGLRQDFDYKFLDQAVITDAAGNIIFNLPQQDMVALRITFRLAFEVANVLNYDQPDAAKRYPFAVMLEP